METTTERRLIDAIFGVDYGVGLPELPKGYYWRGLSGSQYAPSNDLAQDAGGRWFERTLDIDSLYND